MAKSSMSEPAKTVEALRLDEAREQGVPWRQWGPYISERQWKRFSLLFLRTCVTR
jgi:hypothetical protein